MKAPTSTVVWESDGQDSDGNPYLLVEKDEYGTFTLWVRNYPRHLSKLDAESLAESILAALD